MEFPDLGRHCSEKTCKRLDFLPLKCDACNEVFCKDHFTYRLHQCASSYKKDVQVPICPLCNTPVPVRKGETPDAVVGAHIDRDCKRDPEQPKLKIFAHKCFKPGCRRREMMPLVCNQCRENFCLKHRHPLDHACQGRGGAISKAGCAALMRSMESNQKSLNDHFLQSRCKLKS